jgi:hypothetical protein
MHLLRERVLSRMMEVIVRVSITQLDLSVGRNAAEHDDALKVHCGVLRRNHCGKRFDKRVLKSSGFWRALGRGHALGSDKRVSRETRYGEFAGNLPAQRNSKSVTAPFCNFTSFPELRHICKSTIAPYLQLDQFSRIAPYLQKHHCAIFAT